MKKVYSILLLSMLTFCLNAQIQVSTFSQNCGNDNIIWVRSTPSNFNPPITYSIDNQHFSTKPYFNHLSTGTYTVTAKDANNNSITTLASIFYPYLNIYNNIITTPDTCYSLKGSIKIINGYNGYTYTINPAVTQNPAGHFNNLSSGTYTITATDGNGCSVSTVATILESNGSNLFTYSQINPSTCNSNDGSFKINNIPSNITSSTISPNMGTYVAPGEYKDLPAGQYKVSFPGILCDNIINLYNPSTFNLSVKEIIYSNCILDTIGKIQIVPSSYVAYDMPILFRNETTSDSNYTGYFSGLSGVNVFSASKPSGCSNKLTINFNPNNLASFYTKIKKINCGSPGSIKCISSTPNVNYSISPSATKIGTDSFIITTVGYYTITADIGSCSYTNLLYVDSSSGINYNFGHSNCEKGYIDYNNFNQNYLYTLSPGYHPNINGRFYNLETGIYTLTVTDENNCTINNEIALINYDDENPFIEEVIYPMNSFSNGSIKIHAPYRDITIRKNNAFLQTISNPQHSVLNLPPGHYTFLEQNITCEKDTFINLNSTLCNLHLDSIKQTPTKCTQNSGFFQAFVSGNQGGLTYQMNGQVNSNGIFNNLGSGNNLLYCSDSMCSISKSVNLNPKQIIIDSIKTINVSNCTHPDGQIIIYANAASISQVKANGPVNKNSTSLVIDSLPRGNYSLTIIDTNGCQILAGAKIEDSLSSFVANVIKTRTSCLGKCDGSNEIQLINGNNNSNFIIPDSIKINNNLILGNVISNLCEGYIPIEIYKKGCKINSYTSTQNSPYPLCITNLVPEINNQIKVIADGGHSPISYSLGSINWQSSNILSPVFHAWNTFYIRDSLGCISSQDIYIDYSPAFFDNLTTNSSCNNSANGSIHWSNIIASPPYTISIYPIALQNGNSFINLSAGTYTLNITDSFGPSPNYIVTISNSAKAEILVDNVNTTPMQLFNSTCDGNFKFKVVNKTANQILIKDSSFNTVWSIANTQNEIAIPTLADGLYYIIADSICGDDTIRLQIHVNPNAYFNIDSLKHSCLGQNNGLIRITNNAYTYSIKPISGLNPSNGYFTNLAATTFTLQLTDPLGCIKDTIISILTDSLQISTINSVIPHCSYTHNGEIEIIASTNYPPINYAISPIAGNYLGNGKFVNLTQGNYTINVSDANLCSFGQVVSFLLTNMYLGISNVKMPTCIPDFDGEITAAGSGGNSPYTFLLLPDSISNNSGQFSHLTSGNYMVKIADSFGCTADATVTLQKKYPDPEIYSKQNETCIPGHDGNFIIRNKNTSLNDFWYSLNNGPWQNDGQFYGLSKGIYTISSIDTNNQCVTKLIDSIGYDHNIDIKNYVLGDIHCFGDSSGFIKMDKNTIYHYDISPKIGKKTNPYSFEKLPAGNYTITATTPSGCPSWKTINLIQNDSMFTTLNYMQASNAYCYGELELKTNGGIPPYVYNLQDSKFKNIRSNKDSIIGLCPDDYLLTTTDAFNCKVNRKIKIIEDVNALDNIFNQIEVYPNPASDIIYIRSSLLFKYKARLLDAFGQELLNDRFSSKYIELNISHLAPGIYFLHLDTRADKKVFKIIKE